MIKYVALDLHRASTSISIRDGRGRVIGRDVVPTSAARILEVLEHAGGSIHLTFEEGTLSQWIYDQVVSHVDRVIVCDPRHNRLLAAGNKSDGVDADKLSDLLERRPALIRARSSRHRTRESSFESMSGRPTSL